MTESIESFIVAEAAFYVWGRRHSLSEDHHLLSHTRNWLNSLPKGVRPVYLQSEFPRIANDLSRLWPYSEPLDLYFEEKEYSPRMGRGGFRPLISEELLAMHLYSIHKRPVR